MAELGADRHALRAEAVCPRRVFAADAEGVTPFIVCVAVLLETEARGRGWRGDGTLRGHTRVMAAPIVP